jgi:hypothetical protein
MPQWSDDIYLGPAVSGATSDGPSPMTVGVGPMGRVFLFDIAPLTLQAAGLASSANPGSGAAFTLTAGTGVTASVVNGQTRYVLDVARTVTITAAGANTATYTIAGYDIYGQAMTETVAAPSSSTVSSAKMFKSVVSVTNANATAGTNGLTVGYGDVVGLPVRVTTRDYITFSFNATVGLLAAVTVADVTSPATASTGDVRGKITLASAADGTKRLVAFIGLPALASGPNATRIGAFGVTQV